MRLLLESLTEAWRLLRLFAIGCAWGAPLSLAAFVNANPGVSAHPRLATFVEAGQWPVVLAAPLVSIVGIAWLAWLTRDEHGVPVASLLGVFGVFLLLFPVAGVAANSTSLYALVAPFIAAAVALVVGAATTVWTLVRKRRWLGLIWPALLACVGAVVWFAGARSTPGDDDLGAGLLFAFGAALVLGASALGALVAFILPRLLASFRNQRRQLDEQGSI